MVPPTPSFPYATLFFNDSFVACTASSPPLRRLHERRITHAPARRRAKPTTSLGDNFWGALVDDAARWRWLRGLSRSRRQPPVDNRLAGSLEPAGTLKRVAIAWQSPCMSRTGGAASAAARPPSRLAGGRCCWRSAGWRTAARVSVCTGARMNVGISFVLLSIVNTSEFILKASDHYTARNTRATELLFRRQVLSHGALPRVAHST